MYNCAGYGLESSTSPLIPIAFKRREPRQTDLVIEILYCGVCHADLGLARGEWGFSNYPCVPGHEIIGKVIDKGSAVSKYLVGDLVGVGPFVDSCRNCEPCKDGHEQLCDVGITPTYMGPDKDFGHTYGGYSTLIVVDENYVLRVPKGLSAQGAAPLLCAGITAYAPLSRAEIGTQSTVAVVGIGGVGHMALKFARAMGARVVAITTSRTKAVDAIRLGANEVIVSSESADLSSHKERFDLLLDCVSQSHEIDNHLALVRRQGEYCLLGTPKQVSTSALGVVFRQKRITGSFIGGIKEAQEMLNFAAEKAVTADVELIAFEDLNTAWERLAQGDVKYRFVIDVREGAARLEQYLAG